MIGFISGIITGFFIGWIFGGVAVFSNLQDVQKKAIELGCAHYQVTDTLSGTTEFQWRKP